MIQKILTTLFLLYFFKSNAQLTINSIGKENQLKEIAIVKSAWVNLHPGTFRYNTPEEIEKRFKNAEQYILKGVSDREYFLLLAQLAASIKCGHTYINPYNQKDNTANIFYSKSFFPFLYKVINYKFIVTHNLSNNNSVKAGDEIVSINGILVKRIIDSLLTVSRSDGNNSIVKKLDNINIVPIDIDSSNFSLFDTYFPLFFPENFTTPNYSIIVKPYHKKVEKVIVKALSKKERQEIFTRSFGEILIKEKNWGLQFLNTETAIFRIGDFETWEWKTDYKIYLDSVFNLINLKKVKNLIVDVRGNEGGADDARDDVLSYLINKPVGCENPQISLYKFLTIPKELIPNLDTWDNSFKEPKNENEYTKTTTGYYEKTSGITNPCIAIQPKKNAFSGNKYLIINANNSSTTFTLADIFQTNKVGKIIGETTGGSKKGINGGQFFFLRLPYSKLEIDLPIIWGAYIMERNDEGIKPDFKIITTQKDLYKKVDPQLNFILNLISNHK
jgi:hypothetical protein